MKTSGWLWLATSITGLFASILFLYGLGYAMNVLIVPKSNADQLTTQAPASTPAPSQRANDKLKIVAIGDSLTRGVGDETGEGYVGKLKKRLESAGQPVIVYNNGRNGYRTDQLLPFIQEKTMSDMIKQADVILLTIGGNDLNSFGMSITDASNLNSAGVTINYADIKRKMPEAEERLVTILKTLHDYNPKAKIIYVGLYNPYLEQDPSGEGMRILQQWNTHAFISAAVHKNITVVPTYDLFQNKGDRYLYVDRFHPNGPGYERIAERVYQVLQ